MIRRSIKILQTRWPWLRGRNAQLVRLVRAAHRGEISVEELLGARPARGRRSELVAAVAELLLDLKQQRGERAALEQEIRDRIANRTDALERKIGSLQLQATRDALTALGNRRALDVELQSAIAAFQRSGGDACLLMIDVDHFKQLNDTLGHAAGDQLLKEIAQLIRSNLRENDTAYRSGGDEFVVLMRDSNLPVGMTLSSRLCALVSALTRSLTVPLPPQLSIGACALSELKTQTAEALMHTADGRLYAVKALRPRSRRSA
jgi:diguanylate cyclase (GGDEF)-like protein